MRSRLTDDNLYTLRQRTISSGCLSTLHRKTQECTVKNRMQGPAEDRQKQSAPACAVLAPRPVRGRPGRNLAAPSSAAGTGTRAPCLRAKQVPNMFQPSSVQPLLSTASLTRRHRWRHRSPLAQRCSRPLHTVHGQIEQASTLCKHWFSVSPSRLC